MEQPQLTEEDEILLNSFKSVISILSTFQKEIVESDMKQKFNTKKDKIYFGNCLLSWDIVIKCAKALIERWDEISSAENWVVDAEMTIEAFELLNKTESLNCKSFLTKLALLSSAMSVLNSKILVKRVFQNIPLDPVEEVIVRRALFEYTKTAKAIIDTDGYIDSNLNKLDSLLSNTEESVKENFIEEFPKLKVDTTLCFVALAAPSMEGKTQTAFTLRKVKPLYFSLAPTKSIDLPGDQYIYRNFRNHSAELKSCALADLKAIAITKGSEDVSSADISAGMLRGMLQQKFFTVGFLMGLTDCRQPFNQDESWMEYYARKERFRYEASTINDCIESNCLNGYCVFLDEYVCDKWSILVRNLVRVLRLRCVCSNTNTVITNIVGKDDISGSSANSVWSIVIVRLNPPSLPLLNESFGLENSIQVIKNAALRNVYNREGFGEEDTNPICRFLNDFLVRQLPCLRPGAAGYVAASLRNASISDKVIDGTLTLGWLLDTVVGKLASDFKDRKPSLLDKQISFFAKTGLLLSQSYYGAKVKEVAVETPEALDDDDENMEVLEEGSEEIEYESEEDTDIYMEGHEGVETIASLPLEVCDSDSNDEKQKECFFYQRKFIENHLYYVSNPQVPGKWLFLTFPGSEPGECLMTYVGEPKPWKYEYTHFESNELLTMLACLFITPRRTTSTLLKDAEESIYSNPKSISDSQNPRAMKLSGNTLEFSVGVSVVEASQHSFETDSTVVVSRKFTFQGQNGIVFIKNLIVNLISDNNFEYRTEASTMIIEFPKPLQRFLETCRIPFLYSMNRSIALLDSLSEACLDDFFVAKYIRTANGEEIDGKFKFICNGEEAHVVVECKNRQDDTSLTALETVLLKAFNKKNNPKLCLIVCREGVKETPSKNTSLFRLCKANRINFYRVKKIGPKQFCVNPLFNPSSSTFPNPRFVCILFECTQINRKI